jgi:ribosomal protein S18 acetylase RimI-like enzyme
VTLRIRQLRQSDVEAVAGLDRRILGADRSSTWDQYLRRVLPLIDFDLLPYPPWGCFVAEDGREIVGFLLSERQTASYGLPEGARIVAVGVDPARRREGIGRQLLGALIEECGKQAISEVFGVLRGEDGRDAEFLRAAGFSDSAVRVLSLHVPPADLAN